MIINFVAKQISWPKAVVGCGVVQSAICMGDSNGM